MRVTVRSCLFAVWLVVVSTAGGLRAGNGAIPSRPATGECYVINGVRFCPCADSDDDCAPPDCVLIEGQSYCPDTRQR
jgi:hypothetical protein